MGRVVELSYSREHQLSGLLVTIGITTFNCAGTVEKAIRSAFSQTWRPIEIVVVDDCSTDNTFELLIQLADKHPELRVFLNKSNSGVAVSRNRILAEARGEFVAFFDDDDESLPERVIEQMARILKYEQIFSEGAPVICHTARKVLYTDGFIRIQATMGQREGQRAPNGIAVAERILLGTHLKDGYGACPTCSQMARLSSYRAAGGFDPEFRRSEDSELNVRWAKMGAHFVGIAKPLVVQKMTKTFDKSLVDERRYILMLLEKHQDVLNKFGMYNFCQRWIDIKQAWLEGHTPIFVFNLMCLTAIHPLATFRRLALAFPNIGLNRAFARFHRKK